MRQTIKSRKETRLIIRQTSHNSFAFSSSLLSFGAIGERWHLVWPFLAAHCQLGVGRLPVVHHRAKTDGATAVDALLASVIDDGRAEMSIDGRW